MNTTVDKSDKRHQLVTHTAAEYGAMELGEILWAVPGLIPEGASILAGKPKMGKSWMALNMAIAVAGGGVVLGKIQVEPGEVLYLALEDGKRRIKKRLHNILDASGRPFPSDLHITPCCPRADDGGQGAIERWLDEHKRAKLVVIDTLGRFRKPPGLNLYASDIATIAPLQVLGLERGVGILGVTHTRKQKSEGMEANDPLEEVNGTLGLTGTADALLVLSRQRHGKEGKLFVTGRDVDEGTMPVLWSPEFCTWTLTGEDVGPTVSEDQRKAIAILDAASGAMRLAELAISFPNTEYGTLAQMVSRLEQAGLLIRTSRGLYTTQNAMALASNPFSTN